MSKIRSGSGTCTWISASQHGKIRGAGIHIYPMQAALTYPATYISRLTILLPLTVFGCPIFHFILSLSDFNFILRNR